MPDVNDRPAGALQLLRRNALGGVIEIVVNFALPFLIYDLAKAQLGDAYALMASSAPPIVWSIFEFARRRRVDALSILVLVGIGLSLLAFFGGGSVRFLQLRERLVTALVGLVFLVSAAIDKPLIYYLARARIRRRSSTEADSFEARRGDARVRGAMMILTLAWGVALIGDAAICAVLVFAVSIKTFLLVSPIIGYTLLGGMTFWTYWFARRRLRSAPLPQA